MWKDGMFTTQKPRTRRRPEISRSAQWRSDLISSSQGSLPLPAMASRKQESGSRPPLVGCMFCFIRVASHENLGMNIWDSLSTAVCSSAAASAQSSVNFLSVAQQTETGSSILTFTVGEYNHSSRLGLAQIGQKAANGVTAQVALVNGGHTKKGRRLIFHCPPTVSSLPALL